MNPKWETLCEMFIRNRDRVKQAEKLCNSYLPPVCAYQYCAQGKTADTERIKLCRKLLREQTGIFSNFRGVVELAFASMLALEEQPQAALERTLSAYEQLKQAFSASQYLPLAAFLLRDEAEVSVIAARGRELYRAMRKEHPFLTSAEDSVFAVMLARSEKTDHELLTDMEACYALLKEQFHSSNSVQTVSHVLALAEGTPEAKTGRLVELFDSLRRSGRKYSKYYELATLAQLSVLPVDTRRITTDMLEVDTWLSGQKGYGFWGIPRSTRLMHAAMIVSVAYTAEPSLSASAFAGTLGMIISQQIATMAAISAATAASAAAANS